MSFYCFYCVSLSRTLLYVPVQLTGGPDGNANETAKQAALIHFIVFSNAANEVNTATDQP